MSDARLTLDQIEEGVEQRLSTIDILRMAVASVNGDGSVTLKDVFGSTAGAKAYQPLVGNPVEVDDYVIVLKHYNDYIVLGKLFDPAEASYLPLAGGTLTGALTIQLNGVKLSIRSADGTQRVQIDAGSLLLQNLTDLIGASDNGTTQVWNIDTATGNASLGVVTGKGFNSPVWAHETQDTSTDATNASTSTYDTNITGTITLPTGTWTILAITAQGCTNSATSAVRGRTEINASAGDYWQLLCDPGLPVTIVTAHVLAGVTGGGTATIYGKYQPATTGTAGGKGGSWFALAFRTA